MGKSYKIYTINCAFCNNYVLTYHKYGSGKGILRLYFKCIKEFEGLLNTPERDKDTNSLRCTNCKNVLGVKDIKNGELNYRMRKGYFHRKLNK